MDYARWEIITYTITFDAIGGNADKKVITVEAGKTYGKLPEAALKEKFPDAIISVKAYN